MDQVRLKRGGIITMSKTNKLFEGLKTFHCLSFLCNYITFILVVMAICKIYDKSSSPLRLTRIFMIFLIFLFSQHFVYSHPPNQSLYILQTKMVIKSQNQLRDGGVIIVYITLSTIYGYIHGTYGRKYTIFNHFMSPKLRRRFVSIHQNLAKYIVFINCYDHE